jgi:hypothetical protein
MAKAGVAVAALTSLAMSGGLVLAGAAPAGAATTATATTTSTGGQLGQTLGEVEANAQALLANAQADLGLVESVACLVIDIATGQGPPFGAPGYVCAGT